MKHKHRCKGWSSSCIPRISGKLFFHEWISLPIKCFQVVCWLDNLLPQAIATAFKLQFAMPKRSWLFSILGQIFLHVFFFQVFHKLRIKKASYYQNFNSLCLYTYYIIICFLRLLFQILTSHQLRFEFLFHFQNSLTSL